MSESDDNIPFNNRDAVVNLRNKIFNIPLLHQADLVNHIKELDAIIHADVSLLMKRSMFVERYLSDVVAEVVASITHGRIVYEKDSSLDEEDSDSDTSPSSGKVTPLSMFRRASEVKFLELGINLISIVGQKKSKYNKEVVRRLLSEIRFARKVYEDLLDAFSYITKDYIELTKKYVDTHSKFHNTHDSSYAIQLSQLDENLQVIERLVGVKRKFLYHICINIKESKKKYYKIREKIVAPYLRIAYKEAKDRSASYEQFLENFQNGSSGLLRAVSCYSIYRKNAFPAYAKWWVKQAILVYIKEDANFVKLPSSVWQSHAWIEKSREKATTKTGELDMKKLKQLTGYSESKIQSVMDAIKSSQVYSLDYVVDEEQKTKLSDVLISTKDEEGLKEAENKQDLDVRLKNLSETEKVVLFLNYGLFEYLPSKGDISEADKLKEVVRQSVAKQVYQS